MASANDDANRRKGRSLPPSLSNDMSSALNISQGASEIWFDLDATFE